MLIIFDLDDTLVTTSVSITPIKMRDALHAMIAEGLVVPDFDAALKQLEEIDRSQETFRHSLKVFGERFHATEHQLEAGAKEFYHNISCDIPLEAAQGAKEVLNLLAKDHLLAVVTRGNKPTQSQKLEKAGIDTALFSRIIVLEQGCKGREYQSLLQELGYPPSEVIVCGDRIGIDLTPAKELGITTVHIRFGRGLANLGNKEDVDHTIHTLLELLNIVR